MHYLLTELLKKTGQSRKDLRAAKYLSAEIAKLGQSQTFPVNENQRKGNALLVSKSAISFSVKEVNF